MKNSIQQQIRVRGLVQGVGFRPLVWRLAKLCGIVGDVSNDSEGVLIHCRASKSKLETFVEYLHSEVPPLARIDSIECSSVAIDIDHDEFLIIESRSGQVQTGVVADAATCKACLQDISNPKDRRFNYAFTNCTHCGPRLSIIRAIPYDRENTSMDVFGQCAACLKEYTNPEDRRFHAQPNACSVCGPEVWLENSSGARQSIGVGQDAIQKAAERIKQGCILVIKGIGGFHLACDATNETAVDKLRQRKRRYHKAFALMAPNAKIINEYTVLMPEEEAILRSKSAPIVVLRQKEQSNLAPSVAPGQNSLGFMLPYTPLHYLLTQNLDFPIVLTSGNLSEEPQVIKNSVARNQLSEIYDYGLFHDREIVNRLDDSVVRVVDKQVTILRRARGYAPESIALPSGFESVPEILAMGSELKNSFCLIKNGQAFVSQHMGDLEDASTHQDYRHNLLLYKQLFEHRPKHVAVDMHPNYLSTQWGKQLAAEKNIQLHEIQHHHAHIASCMAEHGWPIDSPSVLGIAMDGLGLGSDQQLWGGEFLRVNYSSFERIAHFKPIAMIGAAKAMQEPWRNTYAYLSGELEWSRVVEQFGHLELIQYLQSKPIANMDLMVERGLNAPQASSCGRLFDAVAAALNICRESVSHEGQAAIELEAVVDEADLLEVDNTYDIQLNLDSGITVLSWRTLWLGILGDISAGICMRVIAARFHLTLIDVIGSVAHHLCRQDGLDTVVLSGGVFQNKILLEGVVSNLRLRGYQVLYPKSLPANDGGLSLGQAVVAAARLL